MRILLIPDLGSSFNAAVREAKNIILWSSYDEAELLFNKKRIKITEGMTYENAIKEYGLSPTINDIHIIDREIT